jgi:hypothetical protein
VRADAIARHRDSETARADEAERCLSRAIADLHAIQGSRSWRAIARLRATRDFVVATARRRRSS